MFLLQGFVALRFAYLLLNESQCCLLFSSIARTRQHRTSTHTHNGARNTYNSKLSEGFSTGDEERSMAVQASGDTAANMIAPPFARNVHSPGSYCGQPLPLQLKRSHAEFDSHCTPQLGMLQALSTLAEQQQHNSQTVIE